MKKNNALTFKILILFMVGLNSDYVYSTEPGLDYPSNSGSLFDKFLPKKLLALRIAQRKTKKLKQEPALPSTPEIDKQITTARERYCKKFSVYPPSPENDVYWKIDNPEEERASLKDSKLDYLKKIKAEAKQAERNYCVELEEARLYREEQEHQRRLQIAQQQEESGEYSAWLDHQRDKEKAKIKSPESPDSDIVAWKENSPIYSARKLGSSAAHYDDESSLLTRTIAEDDTRSYPSFNEKYSSFDSMQMHASSFSAVNEKLSSGSTQTQMSSLSQDFATESFVEFKENKDPQILSETLRPNKKQSRDTLSFSQKSKSPVTTTSDKSQNIFSENIAPTQLDVCSPTQVTDTITQLIDEAQSPPRKRMPERERTPFIPTLLE